MQATDRIWNASALLQGIYLRQLENVEEFLIISRHAQEWTPRTLRIFTNKAVQIEDFWGCGDAFGIGPVDATKRGVRVSLHSKPASLDATTASTAWKESSSIERGRQPPEGMGRWIWVACCRDGGTVPIIRSKSSHCQ